MSHTVFPSLPQVEPNSPSRFGFLGLGSTPAPGVAGRAPRHAPCARHCHERLRLLRAPGFSARARKTAPAAGALPNAIRVPSQSARGLAQSKTLRVAGESSANAPASWTAAALRRFSRGACSTQRRKERRVSLRKISLRVFPRSPRLCVCSERFPPVPLIKPNSASPFAERWWKLSRCDNFCLRSRHLERGTFSGSQTIPSPDAALGDGVFAARKLPPFFHPRPHFQPFRLSKQIPRAVLGLGSTHAPWARHCHERLRLLRAPGFSARARITAPAAGALPDAHGCFGPRRKD